MSPFAKTILIMGSVVLASCVLVSCASVGLGAGTDKAFMPKSDYPPDPWVKGYANESDCLGGEKLAARQFELPDYPAKAYRSGRQGWVILRLDVDANGQTQNVGVERAVPNRLFGGNAVRAAKDWRFAPPADGPLEKCRVLIRYRLGEVSLGG